MSLKVAPMKRVIRFGIKGKISHRYISPFEILERVGEVAYQLALTPTLSQVHDVFHISMLRKYVANLDHVIQFLDFEIDSDMSYEERSMKIVDFKE